MKVVLLTNAFPFYPGEQFLEDEIKYWESSPFDEIILLPSTALGIPRSLSDKVKVSSSLLPKNRFSKRFYTIRALLSSIFYKELKFILRFGKFSYQAIDIALYETSKTIMIKVYLKQYLKLHPEIKIVYCYWNTYVSYAASILKKKGIIDTLVTRVHRGDLYEERRINSYMPIKRQFINDFDMIFTLSRESADYMNKQYDVQENKLHISPLGVPLLDCKKKKYNKNILHIISVSFCVPVKRIDKIIAAIAIFSKENRHISIKWTHIGDGSLLQEMQTLALENLTGENVGFCFKGNLSNENVRQYYIKKGVDIFINTSESEGIPVSIMEAMSASIPAIAPNVGGVSDLVTNKNGVLLSSDPTTEEIKNAINKISSMDSDQILRLRRLAREKVKKSFNADKNYNHFIQQVYDIASENKT